MFYWLIILLTVTHCLYCFADSNADINSGFGVGYISSEVDVSWDFNDYEGKSGWANSTAEQMDMEVKVEHGELRCSIIGFSPKFESPILFLNITNRHFVVARAKYLGSAQDARLLLRSGGAPSPKYQLDLGTSYWSERQAMVVNLAPAASGTNTQDKLADSRIDTYYLSQASTGVNIILDLGSFRWVTAMRIDPIGDNRSPKRCLLQQSYTSNVGPFQTVKTFTMTHDVNKNKTQDFAEQRIVGFSGYARYWRLIVLDNYGGSGIGIRELYLDG